MAQPQGSLLKVPCVLKNEEGVVMIAAILILVLLTIVGIAATNTSNTEVRIAGHQVVYLQNFYRAEGAVIEAMELLESGADPATTPWLANLPLWDADIDANIQDDDFWISGTDPTPEDSILADTQFVVFPSRNGEISLGNDLNMEAGKVHAVSIFGRCAPPNRGATVVSIGYLVAF